MLSAMPNIDKVSSIHKCGTMSYAFLKSTHTMARLVSLLVQFLSIALSSIIWYFVHLFLFLHHLCSIGRRSLSPRCLYTFAANIPDSIFHSRFRQAIGL